MATGDDKASPDVGSDKDTKPLENKGFGDEPRPVATCDKLPPRGLEPLTYGLGNRCSIR